MNSVEFLQMKKTFANGLRCVVIAIIFILPFLMVDIQTPNLEIITRNNLVDTKVSRIEDTDLLFFDNSDFTSTSHQINVSRRITSNQYGYTSSKTKITLYNNGSKDINAFNLTLSKLEYEDSRYIKIY
jgi:hypothetical protein